MVRKEKRNQERNHRRQRLPIEQTGTPFANLGLDCPDKDNGKCNKLHVAKDEAERHIAADKEKRSKTGAEMTPRQNT